MEDQVRDRFLKKYNVDVLIRQAYGMSETSLGTLSATYTIKPGSVGEPVPGIYCKVILDWLWFYYITEQLTNNLDNLKSSLPYE